MTQAAATVARREKSAQQPGGSDVRASGEAAGGSAEITFAAAEAGVELSLTVASDTSRLVVKKASHAGARTELETNALDRLCDIVVGRPLQEAADHGAIYLMEAIAHLAAPVNGIRTPRNAGPLFALAERLLRTVHAEACERLGIAYRENRWYVRPSATWLSMTEAEQAEQLKPIIAAFLAGHGHAGSDLWISRIERGTRVTIGFAESVHYTVKPRLLMALERHLRAGTGEPLELFMDDKKDANKIRRL